MAKPTVSQPPIGAIRFMGVEIAIVDQDPPEIVHNEYPEADSLIAHPRRTTGLKIEDVMNHRCLLIGPSSSAFPLASGHLGTLRRGFVAEPGKSDAEGSRERGRPWIARITITLRRRCIAGGCLHRTVHPEAHWWRSYG
jgi:hypothetical protein